jgi:hypothetical protein
MTRMTRLSIALVSVLLIAGCAARGVRVSELKNEPGRYDDRSVSLTGVVTNSWGVPLVPFQFYSVDDGTGEITVLSRSERGAPRKGARVQVKGKVSEFGVFGGRSFGLHIQEQSRKVRRG